MAVQDEQLNLIVNLQDNATPQMERLRSGAQKMNDDVKRAGDTRTYSAAGAGLKEITNQIKLFQDQASQGRGFNEIVGGFQRMGQVAAQFGGRLRLVGVAYNEIQKVSAEHLKTLQAGSTEAIAAARAFGFLATGVTVVGTAVAAAATYFAAAAVKTALLTSELEKASRAARGLGVDEATYRNIVSQFGKMGIDAATAAEAISGLAKAQADLARPDSPLRQGILSRTAPEDRERMNQLIDSIRDAKDGWDGFNAARVLSEEVYRNALDQTGSKQYAMAQKRRILSEIYLPAELALMEKMAAMSDADRRREQEKIDKANDLSRNWRRITAAVGELSDMLLAPLWMFKTLDYFAGNIADYLESWVKWLKAGLDTWEKIIGIVTNPFGALEGVKPGTKRGEDKSGGGAEGYLAPGATPMSYTGQDFTGLVQKSSYEERKSLEENTDALKKNNELLGGSGGYSPVGGPYAGLVQKASLSPGTTYGGAQYGAPGGQGGYGGAPMGVAPDVGGWNGRPQTGGGGGGGGAPYGSDTGGKAGGSQPGPAGDPAVPSDVLAQAKRVALEGGPGAVENFMAAQGYPKRGAWCGEFAASVVKSVGGTPPKNPAIASNWRNYGTEVDTPQPGDIAVRRGAATGATGSHVTIVSGVQGKTFTGLGGNQGGQARESQYATGRFQFFRGGKSDAGPGVGVGAGKTPANADGAAGAGGGADQSEYLKAERAPLVQQLENDPALKKRLGALATLEHEGDETAVVESLYNRTNLMNEERAKKGLPPLSVRDMMYGTGKGSFYGPVRKGLVEGRLRELERDPERMKRVMDAVDRAAGSNVVEGYTDQGSAGDPNYSAGGTGVNRRGERYNLYGGAPGGHAAAARYREYQQRQVAEARKQIDRTQAAKVEGTGKISVDVNAPRGTKVEAEGGGLFKNVEINRQVQMDPASRGPADADMASI
jgi:uncharacterized protein (TIGR02594 family)